MIDLLQIHQRARQGPKILGESFDLDCLYATLTRLVGKYDIKYDPDSPVPSDDVLADKVFDAALDFFVECGVYFQSTKNVVRFSREEVLEALATYNGQCRFGEGKGGTNLSLAQARQQHQALVSRWLRHSGFERGNRL